MKMSNKFKLYDVYLMDNIFLELVPGRNTTEVINYALAEYRRLFLNTYGTMPERKDFSAYVSTE